MLTLAALVWGLGNALTGLTAAKYVSSHSLLPGIDISLANTVGGVLLLVGVHILRRMRAQRRTEPTPHRSPADRTGRAIMAGLLKGLNTCCFVFAATYLVATRALVLESTYVVWSVILGAASIKHTSSPVLMVSRALLLSVGAFLVSDSRADPGQGNLIGPLFGLLAGISYAGFLYVWSSIADDLSTFDSQVSHTLHLLTVSLLTIFAVTGTSVGLFRSQWWVPFTHISGSDTALQTFNGTCVVGIVYLLITIGMRRIGKAGGSSGAVAAFCLSLSIPFTLLTEMLLGRVSPTSVQLFGLVLFMVCFVSLKGSLADTEGGKKQRSGSL